MKITLNPFFLAMALGVFYNKTMPHLIDRSLFSSWIPLMAVDPAAMSAILLLHRLRSNRGSIYHACEPLRLRSKEPQDIGL